jgi:hypothetical protein
LDGISAGLTAAELSILDGVTATAAELNKLAGATVTTAQLDSSVLLPGKVAVGIIYVPANVADPETVTIGADIYEFDRADDGADAGGTILVTAHSDDTPANATDALIAAINASGTEAITAIDISDNEILLVADAVGAVVIALAEAMAGVGNVVDSAAMREGAVAGFKDVAFVTRVPNATEVTLDQLHIPLDFVPATVIVQLRVTSTGALVAWDGDVLITGGGNPYITINNDGSVDFTASHTFHVMISA